jgi:hypothetical protein
VGKDSKGDGFGLFQGIILIFGEQTEEDHGTSIQNSL